MTDPLPLEDVLGIVERRRRRRARVQATVGPVLSVAAVGVAGLVVVAVQAGPGREEPAPLTPAAPGISTLPEVAPGPALEPAYLTADFLPGLVTLLDYDAEDEDDVARVYADATELARVWELEPYPGAKAVLAKAAVGGVPVDPADPQGDEAMADRFTGAGFTEADAEELARAWETDPRTARIVGGVLVAGGYLGD